MRAFDSSFLERTSVDNCFLWYLTYLYKGFVARDCWDGQRIEYLGKMEDPSTEKVKIAALLQTALFRSLNYKATKDSGLGAEQRLRVLPLPVSHLSSRPLLSVSSVNNLGNPLSISSLCPSRASSGLIQHLQGDIIKQKKFSNKVNTDPSL